MSENFAGLDINGSFVREMRLGPKMVRMTVLRAPQSESETQVTRQYDLQFDGVLGFRSNLDAHPWLEIRSHDLLSHSEYLREISGHESRTASSINSQLHHFQIVFDEGEINIIADHFKSSITDEIPHAGSSVSQVNQNHLQIQSKDDVTPSSELACTFCGKQQSEVAQIITGPDVNICDECVTICYGLIVKPE